MNASKLSPDDPRLTAYALGELAGDERAAVEAALADDPVAQSYVEETRRFAAHLQSALCDEPLPVADDTRPPSRVHLMPPYEPQASKLLRFPQLYFVVGGLAAACFAVMVALHRGPTPVTTGKQYVAVDLTDGTGGAAAAAAAEDHQRATAVATAGSPSDPGQNQTVVGATNPAPKSVIPLPGQAGLLADAKDLAAAYQSNPTTIVGWRPTPAELQGSSPEPENVVPKRVVTVVSKRTRPAAKPATHAPAPDVAVEPVRPLAVPPPEIASPAPLPPPALPKDVAPGGQFVAAGAAPVARILPPEETGSFALISEAIANHKLPDPQNVAIEELLNHGADTPTGSHSAAAAGAVGASGEVGPAPWAPNHRLIRLTVYAGGAPTGANPALAAKDVSMEVEFNPRRVWAYRLIGYERNENAARRPVAQRLPTADFRANRTVVALFEVIPAVVTDDPDEATYSVRRLIANDPPRLRPEMVTLRVGYRHAVTGSRQKVVTDIEDTGATFIGTSGDFKYFAGVAAYGMILRQSSHRGHATIGDAITWAEAGVGNGPIAREREEMLDLMRRTQSIMQARHG